MPTKRKRIPRLKVVLWFVLPLVGFYFLFAGQITTAECLACLPAVFSSMWFAWRWHEVTHQPFTLHAPWPRILLRLSRALAIDSFQVARALLAATWRGTKREFGHVGTQAFAPGGNGRKDATRRALVTLGASLAPNGVVIEMLPETDGPVKTGGVKTGGLVLHRLVPAAPAADKAWPL